MSAVQLANTGSSAGDGGAKNAMLGVSAVLAAAVTSGFAGVFFEKVLKGSDMSVWVSPNNVRGTSTKCVDASWPLAVTLQLARAPALSVSVLS